MSPGQRMPAEDRPDARFAKAGKAIRMLAMARCVGHIRLSGDVAEWLKAAVC